MEDETSWFSDHNAPGLSGQAMRTKKQWLLSYLEEPKPIRPNGYFPGTGSRMPNYSLNSDEVNSRKREYREKLTVTKVEDFALRNVVTFGESGKSQDTL